MRCDKLSATISRRPLLPDRDVIATNAWSEAYSLSLKPSLEDEEEERILWPRGVCAYSPRFSGSSPSLTYYLLNNQADTDTGEVNMRHRGCISTRFPQPRTFWIERRPVFILAMFWVADELANVFFVNNIIVCACPTSRVPRGDEVARVQGIIYMAQIFTPSSFLTRCSCIRRIPMNLCSCVVTMNPYHPVSRTGLSNAPRGS